jgi:putative restriction endonuclease
MTVRLVVAVTDREWFDHLRSMSNLPEVNFWAPGASPFKALGPGELFLFKLHAPHNYIVGGGVFAWATTLPCSLAWASFGDANGARSFAEMRQRVARYRRANPADRSDFPVGCRILTQPFFLPESQWIPVPASWARNIVSFKTYATDEQDGRSLWNAVQNAMSAGLPRGLVEHAARYGEPILVKPRLGQGTFRVKVTDVYNRRCAITRERTLPALEAAHIRPYAEGGEHEASNGLLLRRDIHSLFDQGYVTVTPDLQFHVSRRIKEEFENGRDYYRLDGSPIIPPDRSEWRPDLSALRWHNENLFKS